MPQIVPNQPMHADLSTSCGQCFLAGWYRKNVAGLAPGIIAKPTRLGLDPAKQIAHRIKNRDEPGLTVFAGPNVDAAALEIDVSPAD
jgi:hypothetical protein